MPLLHLVRHGRAAAGFHEDHDPGLDELGKSQAEAAAKTLSRLEPLPVISSPLRRCRETSEPLCRLWGVEPEIHRGVAEIPSPTEDLSGRAEWLRKLMPGKWANAEEWVQSWRADVLASLAAIPEDTVIFSHFIAINVAAGHALGDDRVVCFHPDNCSITRMRTSAEGFEIVELGGEAATHIG